MTTLYENFGCALFSHQTDIGNQYGCKSDNYATNAFMRGLDNAYAMTYRPMLTEPRAIYNSQTSAYEYKNSTATDFDVHLCSDTTPWAWEEETNKTSWAAQVQEAMYVQQSISAQPTDRFLKKIVEDGQIAELGPFSHSTFPQAVTLGTIADDELSNLYSMPQTPWFGCDTVGCLAYSNKSWVKDLAIMYGPYFPCHMNRIAYEAAWATMFKLANTPTVAIGGGWNWINPLARLNGCGPNFSVDAFGCYCGQWQLLSSALSGVDTAIAGGNANTRDFAPWSVCGQGTTDYFYFQDSISASSQEYFRNCPVMLPVESFRSDMGALLSYPAKHNINLNTPMSNPAFFSYGEVASLYSGYKTFLEYGTDRAHWGNGEEPTEPVHEGQINLSADYPEYSFAAKPLRSRDGTLSSVSIWPQKMNAFCIPPIRLVGENAWSLLYLWQSVLDGTASQSSHQFSNKALAYAPLEFQRPHYFKHYQFTVGGQAEAFNDHGQWCLSVQQSYSVERWSDEDGNWSPLSDLAPYEPNLARLDGNTFKWYNSNSVLPGGTTIPKGYTDITCTFEIPLPLSVGYETIDGYLQEIAMFDTEYNPSSGYTQAEWAQIVAATRKMFPQTGESKRRQALDELSAEYLGCGGLIPTLSSEIDTAKSDISVLQDEYNTLSVDAWRRSWNTAIDNTWGCNGCVPYFNEDIVPVSAWDGNDPAPFEAYLSWRQTYYGSNGYVGSNDSNHFKRRTTDFDVDNPQENWSWIGCPGQTIIKDMGCEIYSSPVYYEGSYISSYYNAETQEHIYNLLSSIADTLSSDEDLSRIAVEIQHLNQTFPPLTCNISVDPQTQHELTSYTIDYDHWKNTIVSLNDMLGSYGSSWLYTSYQTLQTDAFSGWSYSLSTDQKLSVINGVKSVVNGDVVIVPEWNRQYDTIMGCEGTPILDEISYLSGFVDQGEIDLRQLSIDYDEMREAIELSDITDDGLPEPDDLSAFLNYSTIQRIDGPRITTWNASLNMLAILPDSYSYNLQHGIPSDMYDRDYYDCAAPTSRWPTGGEFCSSYATSLRKSSYDAQLSSNVEKGKMFVHSSQNDEFAFDKFRKSLAEEIDDEAASYYGQTPTPSNIYGTEVQQPSRWNIDGVKLSVDEGFIEGIESISISPDYWFWRTIVRVKFGDNFTGSYYEAVPIIVECSYGPDANTKDCDSRGIYSWTGYDQADWKFKDPPSNFEMYGKMPVAGEDYSLPALSGSLQLKAGDYVLGSTDVQQFAQNLPS